MTKSAQLKTMKKKLDHNIWYYSEKTVPLAANYYSMTQLSIIVPVYNVEPYIRSCMESIFRQGLDETCFEVIIVNDGSTDHSMEVIQDIISQHSNITVINQENLSLSVARNKGIAAAKGEYILMPDSDDLLVEYSLKPLLEKALETKADLVVADFLNMTDEEIEQNDIHLLQKSVFSSREKSGEELFLQDLNPYECYVWRTLYRRGFIIKNKLTFVPGIYFQDVPFTHECYLKAGKCLRASWLLNIYRKGHESSTFSFNKKKTKDFCIAIAKTWELTHLEGLSPQVQDKLKTDVYASFSMMIWITAHIIKNHSDRKEIIDFMRQLTPDLWFNKGIKQKIGSLIYRYMPYWYFYLRYLRKNIINLLRKQFTNK